MKIDELQDLEYNLRQEVGRRRQLGGYSTEAEGILVLADAIHKIAQHMIETYPKKK